ncbi:MAG: BMC domain-containing protein [Candidatus Latescibacteria bacterium]|jgi:microcompartment protein CcmL/EutN|nr:BMC domain-containing protein [Candidatus Latescibacterota bacterium]
MAAIGMIEVEGVAGIVLAGDTACKAADVDLMGWTSIGGFTTVFFSGSVGSVTNALRTGEQAAQTISQHVVAAPMTQPEDACASYVTFQPRTELSVPSGALGLLETRGYGVHVRTNDAMVKAAPVSVYHVLTVMNRVVCSMVMGDVAAVKEALSVGETLASSHENFMSATLIAQPMPDVLRAFGPEGSNS